MIHPQNTSVRYFIYARKSSESEDRQMASIESQIEELKKLAKENGLHVVDILSEAKSAKAPGRSVYNEMMQRIRKGEASGIVCWKLNRLARNPIDGGEVMWMVQQGVINHIFTYGRSYYPTDNVIVMAVELGMANQFVRDLSVDAKRGLKSKAERGWYPAYSTLGYIHNPLKKKGDKEIVRDEERFPLVRKMFDLMLTGAYTPPRIVEMANNEWGLRTKSGRKVARSTIYRIFTDPFYYGDFEYPKGSGNWYQGKHEPMITRDEYDRVQQILGRAGKPRPKTHFFAFTGMIYCKECGCTITAEDKVKRQKNGNTHYYTYYHCTKRRGASCQQKTIRAEELERQIKVEIDTVSIDPELRAWAMDYIRDQSKGEFSDTKAIIEAQQKAYTACIGKFDTLVDMRASGEIDETTFSRKKGEIETEKHRLKSLLDKSDTAVDDWIKKAEELFGFAEVAKFRFKKGTLEEKKEILSFLGSNLFLEHRKLLVELKNEFAHIKAMAKEDRNIRQRLEPLDLPSDKAKLRAEYAQSPTMLRRLDSNFIRYRSLSATWKRQFPFPDDHSRRL